MFGPSGCGKTFLVLDMSLHVVHGKKWLSHDVTSGSVVYLLSEGLNGLYERLKAWHDYHQCEISKNFHVIPFHNTTLWNDETLTLLEQTLRNIHKQNPIKLIVVDTMTGAIAGLDENSSKDTSMFIHNMNAIRNRLNCTIMYVHHCGKDPSRGMRGSSAIFAAVDTCLSVRNKDDYVIVSVEKQKDGDRIDIMKLAMQKHNNSLVVRPFAKNMSVSDSDDSSTMNDKDDRYKNHGKPWSDEQDSWLLNALRKYDINTISQKMSRKPGGILARINVITYRMIQKQGLSIDEACSITKADPELMKCYVDSGKVCK
jgi:hypothetical protein